MTTEITEMLHFFGFKVVFTFLTREAHAQHELSWVSGKSVARWAVKFMQMRYARRLRLRWPNTVFKCPYLIHHNF